jgi:hypothetical protein
MTAALASPELRHARLRAQQGLLELMRTGAAPWTDFLRRLPLTLGESALERSAPYSFSDEVLRALQQGCEGLLDLMRRRQDPDYDREKLKAVLPDERQRVVLWPRRMCPRSLPADGPWRPIVRRTLRSTPDLDAGLMESWLARTGGGRGLVEALEGVLGRALGLARAEPDASGVGLLSHLACLQAVLGAKEAAKRVQIRGLPYGRLERTVGMALYAAFRQAAEDVFLGQGGLPTRGPEQRDLLIVLTSLSPRWFQSIRHEERDELNAYGLSREAEELLEPLYRAALEADNRPAALKRHILRALRAQAPLRIALLQQAACEGLRGLILDFLLQQEDPSRRADRLMAELFPSNAGLLGALEQPSLIGSLAAELAGDGLRKPVGPSRTPVERLRVALERHRAHGPPWREPGPEDEEDLEALLERFLLLRLDEFLQVQLEPVFRHLTDRRGQASVAALRLEYEAGRLYRLATDGLPMLRRRASHEEGQLFVDLKGYTRRTARAKELVMAEFLQREFYEPILEAAARYRTGADLVSQAQNIQLVNLLGDAVAFSGNIVSLVRLARDIQAIFRSYRRRLQEMSPEAEAQGLLAATRRAEESQHALRDERERLSAELARLKQEVFRRSGLDADGMVEQLKQDFEESFARIQRTYRALQERERTPQPAAQRAGLSARLEGIRQAHAALKSQRAETLARLKLLRGEELVRQLGDCLCQGALERIREIENRLRALDEQARALEDALEEERQRQGAGLEAGLFISFGAAAEVLRMTHDVWGEQRVAVSERLNEAARGTARNVLVRTRLDEALEQARTSRREPGLELAFGVHIAETREAGAHDIYNLGEAMSAGALDAFIRQSRNTHQFFRLQVRPADLCPEIQARFLFLAPTLSLVLGAPLKVQPVLGTEVEVFRYVGQVLFRGFEVTRPTAVFEILRPDSPFMRLLAKHHLEAWLENLSLRPERRLEGLGEELSEPALEP